MFRFQQYLVPFTILLVEGSYETGLLLDIYLTTFFGVCNFGNTTAMRVIFFKKCSKFNIDFDNALKNSEKRFCFWDNWIWIGCVNLSLLTKKYLWPTVNVLETVLRILISPRETFSNSLTFTVINKYGKAGVAQVLTVFGFPYHVACRRVLWNGTF